MWLPMQTHNECTMNDINRLFTWTWALVDLLDGQDVLPQRGLERLVSVYSVGAKFCLLCHQSCSINSISSQAIEWGWAAQHLEGFMCGAQTHLNKLIAV